MDQLEAQWQIHVTAKKQTKKNPVADKLSKSLQITDSNPPCILCVCICLHRLRRGFRHRICPLFSKFPDAAICGGKRDENLLQLLSAVRACQNFDSGRRCFTQTPSGAVTPLKLVSTFLQRHDVGLCNCIKQCLMLKLFSRNLHTLKHASTLAWSNLLP